MKKITEEENIYFYSEYDISEWREKCLVLSDVARETICDDLNKGINSPLVALAKLPFPQFITLYLKTYNPNARELNDPALGYKFYLLEDIEMRYLFEKLKDPAIKEKEIREIVGISSLFSLSASKINEVLYSDLEIVPKIISTPKSKSSVNKKYLYICQYIDVQEAERLHLKGVEFRNQNNYVGFDLEKKLDCLNSAGRTILAKYLGLYGTFPKSRKDISSEIRIPEGSIGSYLEKITPYLMHSLEGMKHLLGVEEDTLDVNKTKKYENKSVRDIDLRVQMHYIQNYLLTDAERLILEGYSNTERKLYIARKFMFSNDREISEYLDILIPGLDYKKNEI